MIEILPDQTPSNFMTEYKVFRIHDLAILTISVWVHVNLENTVSSALVNTCLGSISTNI